MGGRRPIGRHPPTPPPSSARLLVPSARQSTSAIILISGFSLTSPPSHLISSFLLYSPPVSSSIKTKRSCCVFVYHQHYHFFYPVLLCFSSDPLERLITLDRFLYTQGKSALFFSFFHSLPSSLFLCQKIQIFTDQCQCAAVSFGFLFSLPFPLVIYPDTLTETKEASSCTHTLVLYPYLQYNGFELCYAGEQANSSSNCHKIVREGI